MDFGNADLAGGRWSEEVAAAAFTLARRFAAGATLWCWAPAWPYHAEHVAVEFVHPVIVGKRALPAVAVSDPDPVAALRTMTRSGDVIMVVAGAGAEGTGAGAGREGDVLRRVGDVLRRAPAWGATTIWVGTGPRPPAGAADHLVWYEGDSESPAATGDMVLSYHVLWELAHVCFEHPGLLAEAAGADGGDGGAAGAGDPPACITCSDQGTVAEVVKTGEASTRVRTAAGTEEIDTTLVDPVRPGDVVLVHAGVAISRVSVSPVGGDAG
jgi:hydrogenase maturation factor